MFLVWKLPDPTRHQSGGPEPTAPAKTSTDLVAPAAWQTAGVPESSGTPTFVCPAGTITGYVDGVVVRATGIPYARADRFFPPQPMPPATAPPLPKERREIALTALTSPGAALIS